VTADPGRATSESGADESVKTVNAVEMFSSVQGEGTTVGLPTLFLRFGECDLRCRWCDSPHTWKPALSCRIERARGTGEFREVRNPVAVTDLIEAAQSLDVDEHAFVSLTGGEPLLQPAPLRELAVALRARGPRVLLETHGLAVDALESVIDTIDLVSMDWKFSSDVRRASDDRHGEVQAFHGNHERFLAVAARAPEVNVKFVVTVDTADSEIEEAVTRIADVAPQVHVIVQPVTPHGPVRESPDATRLTQLCARIGRQLSNVRLIPQTHKIYGAL
jgi:organic radical activating enzyme